jgi:predicted amidohydrolase YtcJ
VATHAIGDRANRVALDAYGAVLGENNDKRFRIEHAQAISLPDFEKFRRLGVIASMQSTHATSDMRWAVKRMGPDRLMGAYAWRRMLNAGVKFANGSDFPVEDPNPFYGLFAAVTRQDRKGFPAGGWMPDQKLTRAEALHSFTLGGAYAAFEERDKGSLEPGKLADFLVLEQDLMTVPELEIPKIRVRMTVLGGRTVFGAQ